MSLRLVSNTAPVERCPTAVDFFVTMAMLPSTMTFLAVDLFFIGMGVPSRSRGQRAIVGGQRMLGGHVVIHGKFG